jgi:nitric oxide reductase NorQ protein
MTADSGDGTDVDEDPAVAAHGQRVTQSDRTIELGEDYYLLDGLRVTVDPEEMRVGEPTGQSHHGLPVLGPAEAPTPDIRTTYYPTAMAADRDSEEVIARAMGELGKPVLLEGEAGTGKNTAIMHVCQRTNRPVTRMNFGADTTVFDLIGEKDLVGGDTVYILGELARAAVFGWTFIADEINMAEGDITSHLHAICEEVGRRRLNLRGTGRTLTDLPEGETWDPERHLGRYIHPEFRFVGTANPLSYAGTSDMNDAFRSRFIVLPMHYLEPDSEADLLVEETGVDEDAALRLTRMADSLREAHRRDELECPLTHRELLKTVEIAGPEEEFMSLEEAAHLVMVGHANLKLDKETIRDTITAEL